ncbi:MAG: TfoX/Sxy family protein [Devosia sp.]
MIARAKAKSVPSESLEHLAERIRDIVGDDPRIREKTMFGGLTFLLNGHILVAAKKDGRILLSVGKEHNDEALVLAGATQMLHGGRSMRGFVWIDGEAIEDDSDLKTCLDMAFRWLERLPPK